MTFPRPQADPEGFTPDETPIGFTPDPPTLADAPLAAPRPPQRTQRTARPTPAERVTGQALKAIGTGAGMLAREAARPRGGGVRNAIDLRETTEDIQSMIDTETSVLRNITTARAMSAHSDRPIFVEDIDPPLSEDPIRPGLLQIAIDYASRPISAIMGTPLSLLDEDPATTPATAVGKALRGEEKHFFNEVLEAIGVPELGKAGFTIGQRVRPGRDARLADPAKANTVEVTGRDAIGLLGDIGFDPTTYLSLGMGRALQLSNGLRLSKKGEQALGAHLQRLSEGLATREGARSAAEGMVKTAVDAGDRSLVARGGFKWAGMTIPGTDKAGEAFRATMHAAGDAARATKTGAKLEQIGERVASKFNRDYLIRRHTQYVGDKQAYFNRLSRDRADLADEMQTIFKDVTNEADGRAMTHAIEAGEPAIHALPPHLRDAARQVVASQTALRQEEIALGLGESFLDDYMLHAYENYPAIKQAAQGSRLSPSLRSNKERIFLTLDDAKAQGLIPATEDARQLFMMRKLASSRAQAARQLIDDAAAKAGVSEATVATRAGQAGRTPFAQRVEEQLLEAPNIRTASGDPIYLPRRIAEDMAQLGADDLLVGSDFARFYDSLQNVWKGSVTSIFPAFHVRNAVSNVTLSSLDIGIDALNPIRRAEALHVLGIPARETAGKLAFKVPPQSGTLYTKFGERYSYRELRRMFREQGLEGAFGGKLGLQTRNGSLLGGDNPLFRIGRQVGERIESEARMTHFLSGIRRGMDPAQAAARTKQFLFDYENLSRAERTYIRRAIPFYTFYRKNVPLQMRALATEPGRQSILLKMFASPGDQTQQDADRRFLPEYVTDGLAIKVGDGRDGPVYMYGTGLPIEDLNRVWPQTRGSENRAAESGRRNVLSMLGPMAKIFMEEASGQDLFLDRPLDEVNVVYQFYGAQIEQHAPDAIKQFLEFRVDRTRKGDKVYRMNPRALHIMRSFVLSRLYSTAGKQFDQTRDAGTVFLNNLTGLRLGEVSFEDQIYPRLRQRAVDRLTKSRRERTQQERAILARPLDNLDPPGFTPDGGVP